jgi:predicted ferric reductase
MAYLAFALTLQFINNDVPGPQWYTAVGVRAGWLAVAQVSLLVLLAGKNNLIGLLSGTSYERLHVYHRWVARGLLLLATFHFGFFGYSWNKYGIMQLEWRTDTAPPTGIAAYAILLWMNLSTLAPLRN